MSAANTADTAETAAELPPAGPRPQPPPGTVVAGIAAFAALELGLALFTVISPHSFYTAIGPFGAFNPHYLRDVASFEGAIGIALVLAIGRPSWRVPVLALATFQFALHSLNHLFDIGKAHPAWTGYFDFFSLFAATVLLAWLWRMASAEAAVATTRPATPAGAEASLSPTPGRSTT
jgi:hypothetical protein